MTGSVHRRSALRTVALGSLALLAGCVSSDGDDQSVSDDSTTTADTTTTIDTTATTDASGTTDTIHTTTAAREDCEEVASPPTPEETDEISSKRYPDFPTRLSRSNVTEFVRSYERAYKHNRILESERNVTYIDIGSVEVSDVNSTGKGFVVRVTTTFGWGQRRGGSDETATKVHADGGSKVSYLVGERILKRVEPDEWEFADPRTSDGTLLRCGATATTE